MSRKPKENMGRPSIWPNSQASYCYSTSFCTLNLSICRHLLISLLQDMKKLPIKSIQSPQELLLLDRITEAFGKSEQRLQNLQDSNLGPESVVAKGDWALWRLRLRLMGEGNQWQELFDLCGSMLKRSRTPSASNQLEHASFSDWIVWEGYLKSASFLGGSRCALLFWQEKS